MTPRDKAIRELHVEVCIGCDMGKRVPGGYAGCDAKDTLERCYDAGYAAAIERAAEHLEDIPYGRQLAASIRALKDQP